MLAHYAKGNYVTATSGGVKLELIVWDDMAGYLIPDEDNLRSYSATMSSDTVELETIPPGGSFLTDLPPPIQRYPYEGIPRLLAIRETELRRQQSEWILFTGVDNQTFTRNFFNSEDKMIQRCWTSYDRPQNLLLVKTWATRPHEVAHQTWEWLLFEALSRTLRRSLQLFGSAACCAESGSCKQPDLSFLPFQLPHGRTDKWPSMVVETTYPESPKLLSDARFWLSESKGDLKMVLTINIDHNVPKVTFETWILNYNGRIYRDQVVTVYKEGDDIHVRGRPLVVEFEKLFLRPSESPEETNISFDGEMLEYIATCVWEAQRFERTQKEEEEERGTEGKK